MHEQPERVIPLPRISVRRAARIASAIRSDPLIVKFIGKPLDGNTVEALAETISRNLPKSVLISYVRDSLFSIIGQVLTPEILNTTAIRLAGNVDRLRYSPVYPWNGQAAYEWVHVRITDVWPAELRGGELRYAVSLQGLTGSAAAERMRAVWSRRMAAMVAKRLGFGKLRLVSVEQLSGMLFLARLCPSVVMRAGDMPRFDQIRASPACIAQNKELLAKRQREAHPKPVFRCPKGYAAHAVPCHLCPLGRDRCPAAVRSRTFVRRVCPVCSVIAWINPCQPSACLRCTVRGLKDQPRSLAESST